MSVTGAPPAIVMLSVPPKVENRYWASTGWPAALNWTWPFAAITTLSPVPMLIVLFPDPPITTEFPGPVMIVLPSSGLVGLDVLVLGDHQRRLDRSTYVIEPSFPKIRSLPPVVWM